MVSINPKKIVGNWVSGVALDTHTLSSVHLGVNEHGHDIFDTKRSPLGELLYKLKYTSDLKAAEQIIETAAAYLAPHRQKFDLIIPVPPSGIRAIQPVITLAQGIGNKLALPVVECVTTTRPATQLKGVMDKAKREELLVDLHAVDATYTRGKNILLFDDLYRSGSTMNAITNVLNTSGQAASVRVLAITHTRSNQ